MRKITRATSYHAVTKKGNRSAQMKAEIGVKDAKLKKETLHQSRSRSSFNII